MEYNTQIVLTPVELNLFKGVIHDYSAALINVQNRNYWLPNLWVELCNEYNVRAASHPDEIIPRQWRDIIRAGILLHSQFCRQRVAGNIDQMLRIIFDPCQHCQQRIPVFVVSLLDRIPVGGQQAGAAVGGQQAGAAVGEQ